METALSSCNRRTISLRVMSFASSIMPTMKSSWASWREPPRRPCLAGDNRPARALAIQAMAVEIPIPNRAAAERADMPSRDAASTRLRRSSLKARIILPSTKPPVGAMEADLGSQWNPQRDSPFNGRALEIRDEIRKSGYIFFSSHWPNESIVEIAEHFGKPIVPWKMASSRRSYREPWLRPTSMAGCRASIISRSIRISPTSVHLRATSFCVASPATDDNLRRFEIETTKL